MYGPHRSLAAIAVLCLPRAAWGAAWEDATAATIGATKEWSNKLELADINGDGLVDILFANGAGYSSPEGPEQNRAFLNQGPGEPFKEVSQAVFGAVPDQTRVIKVRDLDGDGAVDIVVGNTFESQSRLYLGDGVGGFTEATQQLPQKPSSVGDLELGDVDGDGDLDIVLADWGPGQAGTSGGVTQLWLGDGAGSFVDATATNMPDIPVEWSWEMELADVDNDYDLDVLVSCKTCAGSFMFHNDGAGKFVDATDQLPQFKNNYEFEAIDLTGDGFLDLITINDGPMVTEHIFVGDGLGGFEDATAELWPKAANIASDDNMVAFLDVESDGDADFVIAGLFGGPDRLLINDGTGTLSLEVNAFAPNDSQGSLGIAVADLNGDGKLDVAFSEGEADQDADRVFFGVDVPVDTAAPRISLFSLEQAGTDISVRARIHDNKTPIMPHDFTAVELELTGGEPTSVPLTWYGEALWRGGYPGAAEGFTGARVCATDAAGNKACSEVHDLMGGDTDGSESTGGESTGRPPTTGDAPTTGFPEGSGEATTPAGTGPDSLSDADTNPGTGTEDGPYLDDGGGCGCRGGGPIGDGWSLAFGTLLLSQVRRRRR